jgi:hypothetical protein
MKNLLALVLLAAPAAAQSFNVDIGITFGAPSSSYGAAAGQSGNWNEIDMAGPINNPMSLTDVNGTASAVTVEYNKTGNGNFSFDNTNTTGDDEALLDDCVDVGSGTTAKVKYTFLNLNPGTYDVYVYAFAPDNRTGFIAGVEVIGGTKGIQTCGGVDWGGTHVMGETYVTDTVTVVSGGALRVRYSTNTGFASGNGIQVVEVGGGCTNNATSYCTPGTSASGCQALLTASGTSSATAPSGFVLTAMNTEGNKSGLVYFGTAQKLPATMVGNSSSFQCVNPPVKRSQLLTGGGTNGNCDGTFSVDLNARWASQPAQNPGAGATVFAQLWYRDPTNTSNQTTSRSDGVSWTVCP